MKEYYFALLGMSSALRHCVGSFSLDIVLRNRFTTNSYSALHCIAFHCLAHIIYYNSYHFILYCISPIVLKTRFATSYYCIALPVKVGSTESVPRITSLGCEHGTRLGLKGTSRKGPAAPLLADNRNEQKLYSSSDTNHV